jgi:DNA-directed RNA polymerase subunit RPC12/RpoP
MSLPQGFTPRRAFDEPFYRRTLNAGIAAVKGGDFAEARLLLRKAAEMKPTDPLPWLWLSATTQDPAEQKEFLEYALAADPNNSAARRGLAILSGKVDRNRLLAEGEEVAARRPEAPLDAQAEQVFRCENCGGRMRYQVSEQMVICENCGARQHLPLAFAADEAEQVLDFVLPTSRAHTWAEAQHRLACNQCGAVTLLDIAERAVTCPHCGSSQLIESEESAELLQPNAIAPPKISPQQASELVSQWLGKGLFIPDDLKKLARPSTLRAVYYPFWTFDGILKMNWVCEVNRGSSRNPIWVVERGEEFEIFDDEWVAGLSLLSDEDLKGLAPLDFKAVVTYDPAFLVDWSVLAYNHSLAEASLDARERLAKRLRQSLNHKVLPGQEKRNLQGGAPEWSGMTYKLVLFPFYVGHYTYRGKAYHLFVNAQNGKVSGAKPVDRVKQVAFFLLVALSAIVLLLALYLLGSSFGGFEF